MRRQLAGTTRGTSFVHFWKSIQIFYQGLVLGWSTDLSIYGGDSEISINHIFGCPSSVVPRSSPGLFCQIMIIIIIIIIIIIKEKFGSCTRKTFDRFITKDSYT